MSFLVDTDICSAQLKGVGEVCNRFLQYGGRLNISAVSVAELYSWVLRRSASQTRHEGLLHLLSEMVILPVDDRVARRAGECRASLLDQGIVVATTDLLIASTALVHGLTLVTHNGKHFNIVPDLHIEDWLID